MVSLDCRSGRFRLLAREQTGRHFAPHQSPTDGWRFRRTTFSVGKSINVLWTWGHMLICVAVEVTLAQGVGNALCGQRDGLPCALSANPLT